MAISVVEDASDHENDETAILDNLSADNEVIRRIALRLKIRGLLQHIQHIVEMPDGGIGVQLKRNVPDRDRSRTYRLLGRFVVATKTSVQAERTARALENRLGQGNRLCGDCRHRFRGICELRGAQVNAKTKADLCDDWDLKR